MLCSGRRHIDICRVKQCCFRIKSPGKYQLIIPCDKSHSNWICFEADLNFIPNDWLPSTREKIHIWLSKLLKKGSDYPFDVDLGSNTSRNLNLCVHQLRTLAAVNLKVRGFSDASVLERIGWTDPRMLDRYVKVILPGRFPSTLSAVVSEINFYIDKIYEN